MNENIRRPPPPAFKAKVALEAIKGEKTIAEIASIYSVHTTQIKQWKDIALANIEGHFSGKQERRVNDHDELVSSLYQQIGQLTMERDWLKKKVGLIDR